MLRDPCSASFGPMCSFVGQTSASEAHLRVNLVGCTPISTSCIAARAAVGADLDCHDHASTLLSNRQLASSHLIAPSTLELQLAIERTYGVSSIEFNPQYCGSLSLSCDSG